MIRVMVVDDHEFVRSTMVELIDGTDDMQVVGEAENGAEALPAARDTDADVRRRHHSGEKTALFKIMEKKGRGAHERGVAEALERGDELAVDLIDRGDPRRSAPASPRP